MFHKVKSVTALQDYILLLHFADGTAKYYDVKPLFANTDAFNDLQTVPGLFARATVDPGGYGISWNDDIDIDAAELWANGSITATPFSGLLAFSDATALWNLHESTLRKAVSYKKLQDGVDVLKFGKQWVVTREAMLREYGQPSGGTHK